MYKRNADRFDAYGISISAVSGPALSVMGVFGLARLPQLKRLEIKGCEEVTRQGPEVVSCILCVANELNFTFASRQ
jgi:hypothetical protein